MDYTIFVILAPLTALAAAVAMAILRPYRSAPGASMLIVLLALTLGWLLTNTLEVVATSRAATQFWAKTTYCFSSFTPVAWFAFALAFSGRRVLLKLPDFAIFIVVPFITLALAVTNEHHGLIWTSYAFIPAGSFLAFQVTHGAAFWVQVAYSYSLIAVGSALIIRTYFKSSRLYRRQSQALLIGAVVPFLFHLVYVFGLFPQLQKDYSPLAIAVAALVLAYTIRLHGLFDLKPVARNLLVDSMTEGMMVLDDQHRIVDINPAACEVLGASEKTLLGQPIHAVLAANQRDTLERFSTFEDVSEEVTLYRNGLRYHYEVRVSPLSNTQRQPAGRLVLLHDITERREAEAALQKVNKALHARNEELDAFAHTVAHDLNSPLQGIIGFSSMLVTDLDDPEQREFAHDIMQTAAKMHTILQELMLFAGVHKMPVKVQRLDMETIVEEALHRLKHVVKQQQAEIKMPKSWPAALGHAPWIEEVWVNYISNALKYGGKPPHIELGAEYMPNGDIRYWVRDNGSGISLDQQAQLFAPFTRLSPTQAEGHGLGLSIVQRIMEKLQGNVGIESRGIVGEGSLFYFTLPAAPSEAPVIRAGRPRPVEA